MGVSCGMHSQYRLRLNLYQGNMSYIRFTDRRAEFIRPTDYDEKSLVE